MELSSIKIKMILLVTAILVCGFLTTNILSFQVSKNALRTTLLNNELPLTSDNIYSEIQSDFIRPVLVSSLMANDTFLRDWVTGGENDVGKISRYLDAIRKRYNAFTAFFISNNTLNYYHFSGPSRTLNATDPHDAWFFRVRDMVDTYEINVDENKEQENALTIFINYKTFDGDGNFIGVSGVGLGLDSVKEVVKKYEQIFARNIFFVDKEGVIRVSSRGEIVNKNIKNLKGMQDLVDDSLSQERGSFSYSRDGEEYLLTTRYIPELKWYLFVELPESEATSGIRRGFVKNIIIGLGVIAVTIVLVIYVINIAQRQLEVMAVTDKLTGLGNRQAFDISLKNALSTCRRNKEDLSLMMIDFDNFKSINDKFGHIVGDEVIKKSSNFIKSMLRDSDTMCRWGGEEFAVIMPACDIANASTIADKIRDSIMDEIFVGQDIKRKITISIGISDAKDGKGADEMLRRADYALYQAKANGRNRIEIA